MPKNKKKGKDEVVILIVLIYIIVAVVFYLYLLSPKMEAVSELQNDVDMLDMELRGKYTTVMEYDENRKNLIQLRSDTKSKMEDYYVNEQQETYLRLLRSQMSQSLISFERLDAEEYTNMDLSAEYLRCDSPYSIYVEDDFEEMTADERATAIKEAAEEIENLPGTKYMSMKLSAKGPYSSLKLLLRAIDKNDKHIIVNNMDVFSEEDIANGAGRIFDIEMDIHYVTLEDWACMENLDVDEELPEYTMPQEFLTGEYKGIFSLKDAGGLFQ